jgi:hypothetical protein|uniref:DUF4296 domain-containing protein n=1 Tax=Gelidibacter sp. TaxID=2018083 RepID=UPI00404A69B0
MKQYIIILISVLVFGCNGVDKPKKPNNLISKDKMVDVLYDVYVLNAAKGINKNVLESNGIQPERFLFKKHDIDSLQFAQSNNYYAYDIKTYEGIVEKVKARMENDKLKYDALAEKEKEKQDSLTNKNKIKNDSLLINQKIKQRLEEIKQ